MTIETKYDKDQRVIVIQNNELRAARIKDIKYSEGKVTYKVQVKEPWYCLEDSEVIERDEKDVFKSINHLTAHFTSKNIPK